MTLLELALLLMAVAAMVSILAEAVRFPYTIALVITGLVAGNLRVLPAIAVPPEVFLTLLIPPLLFEGGLRLPPWNLRPCAWLIGLLAIPGTLIAALAIGGIAALAFHLDARSALVLGAIASATDPVGVLAFVRELRLDPRLGTILTGEAVLNDGVAIVLFTIFAGAASPRIVDAAGQFVRLVGVGTVVGICVALAVAFALGRTRQPLVEALGSLIVGLGAFVAAESSGASGVIAVVASGMVFGGYGLRYLTEAGRETVRTVWDVIAFLANSVLFLLIGFQVPAALLARHVGLITAVILGALAVRAVTVYGFTSVTWARSCAVPLSWRHLLVWSGLRAGVPIALVLGLSQAITAREAIAAAVFGLVVFTLLGQGLSAPLLMRRLGLIGPIGAAGRS